MAPARATHAQWHQVLRAHAGQLVEVFSQWDEDGSGQISREEFCRAVMLLGMTHDGGELDALFDHFDKDGSGTLSRREFERAVAQGPLEPESNALAARKTANHRAASLIEPDARFSGGGVGGGGGTPPAGASAEQLLATLAARVSRLLGILNAWSAGTQHVTQPDFRRALPCIGLVVPRAAADALFRRFDPDRLGAVERGDLAAALLARRHADAHAAREAREAAMRALRAKPRSASAARDSAQPLRGGGRAFGCSAVRVRVAPPAPPAWSHERHRTTDPRHFDHATLRASPRKPPLDPRAMRPASARAREAGLPPAARPHCAPWRDEAPPVAPWRAAERGWAAPSSPFVPPAGGAARGTPAPLWRYEAFLRGL